MYELLIVDDQKKIREGLRIMIEQLELPFKRIEVAENGLDAMSKLEAQHYDLVIADIRMPLLDGLGLMKEARILSPETLFLIVSGHDDFRYAQTAMSLGAKAYLLKPVGPTELRMCLDQILLILDEQAKARSSTKMLAIQEANNRRHSLQLFAHSGITDASLAELQDLNPTLWADYRLYRLIPSRYGNEPVHADPMQTSQYILTALESICPADQLFLLEYTPHLLVVVKADHNPVDLSRSLHERTIFSASCITRRASAFSELPDLYRESELLYRYTYLFPEKSMLMPEQLDSLISSWTLPLKSIHELFQLIGYEATYPLTEALSELFRKETLQCYTIDYFEALTTTIVNRLREYERVILPWVGKDRLDLACLKNPYTFPNIRSYLEELQKQFLHLNNHYAERSFSYRNSDYLRDAITFIQQNYDRNIDLATVSNHVNLNYAYFSSIFKKNIGKSFSEYLRDVRIDHSKHLLVETDENISTIAKNVGFDSYRSFVRSFQEVTGQQASEFRKLNQELYQEAKDER